MGGFSDSSNSKGLAKAMKKKELEEKKKAAAVNDPGVAGPARAIAASAAARQRAGAGLTGGSGDDTFGGGPGGDRLGGDYHDIPVGKDRGRRRSMAGRAPERPNLLEIKENDTLSRLASQGRKRNLLDPTTRRNFSILEEDKKAVPDYDAFDPGVAGPARAVGAKQARREAGLKDASSGQTRPGAYTDAQVKNINKRRKAEEKSKAQLGSDILGALAKGRAEEDRKREEGREERAKRKSFEDAMARSRQASMNNAGVAYGKYDPGVAGPARAIGAKEAQLAAQARDAKQSKEVSKNNAGVNYDKYDPGVAGPARAIGAKEAQMAALARDGEKKQVEKEAFQDAIHMRESQLNNYGEISPDRKAFGRYQMREPALMDAGLLDENGNWTGKYGVRELGDFMKNPDVQDQAFHDYMSKVEGYLEDNGSSTHIGQKIDGIKETFTVTKSGLLAASHRQGHRTVGEYLSHQKNNDWKSDFSGLSSTEKTKFKRVETRLREFSKIPYGP